MFFATPFRYAIQNISPTGDLSTKFRFINQSSTAKAYHFQFQLCSYFTDPNVCIGPVATHQVREEGGDQVQHAHTHFSD